MSDPADTPAGPDARLVAVRPLLLDLHRQMLEAERADVERFQGRLADAEFLQIATGGLRMAWLTPLSELIVALDEALEGPADEAAQVDATAIIARVSALIAPPDPATAFGRRYLVMLQQNPAVVMAHSALVARVSQA
ncbi:MAG TPA: hypothetical protein VGL44_09630 [Gaiellales bacterium]